MRYSNITASLALFIALGGTGYAATALPRNSVGSKQIKRAAVARSDLRRDAVTSSKVKDGSLQAGDFAAGQLPQGPRGERGPQGLRGPAGAQGTPGKDGVRKFVIRKVVSGDATLQSGAEASCATGEHVIAGGVEGVISTSGATPAVIDSHPAPDDAGATPTGWRGKVRNASSSGSVHAVVYAICAS